MEPFLKWAGGKRWLIPTIRTNLPRFDVYYEPFAGSAGLFFALEPRKAVLSDTNGELINCYRCIRDDPGSIIRVLERLPLTKLAYYIIRKRFLSSRSKIRRAAYFIYLNKTCWNGLYRENRQGKFNVPVGRAVSTVCLYDRDQLTKASKLLRRARIRCVDFEKAVNDVRSGDLVYFDPPYITTHLNNGFIKYNAKLFSPTDELRLATVAKDLAQAGVQVLVSNAAHQSIRELFDGPFYKKELLRQNTIAADSKRRAIYPELLITTFPVLNTPRS